MFYCASADLPTAFAAASTSAVWCARVRTVASSVSHLSCFAGLPAAFFGFMSYIVFSWHHPSLRAVPSLSKPGALLHLLSDLFCSSEWLAPR